MRILFVLLTGFVAVILNGCSFNVPLISPPKPLEEKVVEGEGRKKILLLDVSGIVSEREKSGGMLSKGTPSMVDRVREALKKAEADDDIAGAVAYFCSPDADYVTGQTLNVDGGYRMD